MPGSAIRQTCQWNRRSGPTKKNMTCLTELGKLLQVLDSEDAGKQAGRGQSHRKTVTLQDACGGQRQKAIWSWLLRVVIVLPRLRTLHGRGQGTKPQRWMATGLRVSAQSGSLPLILDDSTFFIYCLICFLSTATLTLFQYLQTVYTLHRLSQL